MTRTEHGRDIPPSIGRVAFAARCGLFPRTTLLGAGLVLITFALLLKFSIVPTASTLRDLFAMDFTEAFTGAGTLETALASEKTLTSAKNVATTAVRLTLPLLFALFVAAALGTLVPALVFHKRGGSSAVALPKEPKPGPAVGVVKLMSALLVLLIAVTIFKSARYDLVRLQTGDQGALIALGGAIFDTLLAAGALFILTGLCEVALMRQKILGALSLNRSEARAEHKASAGDPALSRERQRRMRQGSDRWAPRGGEHV